MKQRLLLLVLGLILLLTPPAVVYAGTLTSVYADSTTNADCSSNTGVGTYNDPVKLCPLSATGTLDSTYFKPATDKLVATGGELYYVYQIQGSVYWAKYLVGANGSVDPRPVDGSPGQPPHTGNPIAESTLWISGAVLAVLLMGTGLFLRSRRVAAV